MIVVRHLDDNKNECVMYVFGLTTNDFNKGKDEGMYLVNNGDFVKMNNDTYQLGDNPRILIGDRNIYGTLYVGSNGKGLFYSIVVSSIFFIIRYHRTFDSFTEFNFVIYTSPWSSLMRDMFNCSILISTC